MKFKKTVISLSLVVSFFAGNCYAYNEDLFETDAPSNPPQKIETKITPKIDVSTPIKKTVTPPLSTSIQIDTKPIDDPKYNKIVLEPIPETIPKEKKKIRLPSAFEDNTPVAKMVDYDEYLKTQKKTEKPKPIKKEISNNQTPEQYVDDFFDYNKTNDNQLKVNNNKDANLESNISNFFAQYNTSSSKADKEEAKQKAKDTKLLPAPSVTQSNKKDAPINSVQQPKVLLKDEINKKQKDKISLIPIPETLPKRQYIPHAIRGDKVDKKLLGSDVYIRIFKEDHSLEMYLKQGEKYYLANVYNICTYNGGLGPKKYSGDNKSPEGFYRANLNSLQPNSSYYKAINIGFPNAFDRSHGYTGKYLMIHGGCQSIGCYAMTNDYIKEIYQFVQASFKNGQRTINIDIFPFRMTDENLNSHKNSPHYAFWKQLQPGYKYFEAYRKPPEVDVVKGEYVVNMPSDYQDPEKITLFANNQ